MHFDHGFIMDEQMNEGQDSCTEYEHTFSVFEADIRFMEHSSIMGPTNMSYIKRKVI